ncbi:MAG: YciI family protein [Bryobacteraceae bacterium]|jgi:hypothetical protein
MKYMMLIYLDENAPSQAQREECYKESAEYARELARNGKCLATAPLYPTSTATSIRMRDGKRLVTDGPFAETREQLGGYYIINADDLDEAISIASQIPAGRWGTVEIRPVIEIPGAFHDSGAQPVDLAHSRST